MNSTTREIEAALIAAGFQKISCKKHIKFRHPDGRQTVLSKGNKEVPYQTLKKIEKQTGIKLT
jgi:predicted RNA binding protein YcfA (HicA-like mRNA interferase family)